MLTEFRTLVAIAQAGTFTGAGRLLGLTQSAVSAQVKRLEAFVGAPLFERSAKSAVLNARGREVLADVQDVLARAERLRTAHPLDAVKGTLRVGAIASIQQRVLGRALAVLNARHPDVRVRIVPGVSLGLLGMVDAGEVDLAVMIQPPFELPLELLWQPLLAERMALAVPEGTPGDDWRQSISSLPFIRYDRASFGGRAVDRFLTREHIAVREFVELDDIEAMLDIVRTGLGVALVPHMAHVETHGLRLIDLGDEVFFRHIGIVARRPLIADSMAGAMAAALARAAGAATLRSGDPRAGQPTRARSAR